MLREQTRHLRITIRVQRRIDFYEMCNHAVIYCFRFIFRLHFPQTFSRYIFIYFHSIRKRFHNTKTFSIFIENVKIWTKTFSSIRNDVDTMYFAHPHVIIVVPVCIKDCDAFNRQSVTLIVVVIFNVTQSAKLKTTWLVTSKVFYLKSRVRQNSKSKQFISTHEFTISHYEATWTRGKHCP